MSISNQYKAKLYVLQFLRDEKDRTRREITLSIAF